MPLLELCLEQYGNRSWKDKKIKTVFCSVDKNMSF